MQSLTVITTKNTRVLTKNHETSTSYDKVSRLTGVESWAFDSLKRLKRYLHELADKKHSCVIRGVLRDDAPTPLRRRLTHFSDEPQSWVMLDIDDLHLPKSLRSYPYTDEHLRFVRERLPPEFQNAGFVWQASASAGLDKKRMKVHLWFLLDLPLTAAQLRQWFKSDYMEPMRSIVDPVTLRAVQPHYTADPIGGPAGKRLGLFRGPRVTVPELLPADEPEPAAELAKRPKGAADVSDAFIESATKQAIKRARDKLNGCTVAYHDAYTVGTLLGPAVALQTWNDRKLGHKTWQANGERLARKWGARFAALEGAQHSAELYEGRVLEGLEWGVRQERARLAARSQRALDEARERTKELREQLLGRMLKNAGSERVLAEVGKALGRYSEVIGRDELVESLVKVSGLSRVQVEASVADAEPINIDAWREGLLYSKEEIVATDENIIAIYKQYPGFLSSFRYNVRTSTLEATCINILGLAVGPISADTVPCILASWLGSLGMRKVAAHRAYSLFASIVPSLEQYDPFLVAFPEALYERERAQQELQRIKPRLDNWLSKFLGVEGDAEYVQAIAAKTLIAAVARAVSPGAKVDTMLVLIGEQGIGKTSVVQTLASVIDNGYAELLSTTDKDSLLAMQGALLVEFSELRALRSTQDENMKAFLSRRFERIRAPYARQAVDHLRRMVFIGTTNDDDFLSDTVNRRYWPAHCNTVCRMTRKQAKQLWREAALRYAAGEQWWLTSAETELQATAAEAVREHSPAEDVLRKQLKGRDKISLQDAIRIIYPDVADWPKYARGVARMLKILGWTSKRTKTTRFWTKR